MPCAKCACTSAGWTSSFSRTKASTFCRRVRGLDGFGGFSRGCISARTSRDDEAVVDEDVLLDVEGGVPAFEIASPVVGNALVQGEVLCPGRRLNRIGLDEAERVDGVLERDGRKKASRDGKFAEIVQCHVHPERTIHLAHNARSHIMLSAGTRLGPYEIVAAVGAGGMGEVYRARDTRLARDVAIKVLASSLAYLQLGPSRRAG